VTSPTMELTTDQRKALSELLREVFGVVSLLTKELAETRNINMTIGDYAHRHPLFEGLPLSMPATDFIWRASRSIENMPTALFYPNFSPLKMAQFLQYLHMDHLNRWSPLARRAALILGYELPEYSRIW